MCMKKITYIKNIILLGIFTMVGVATFSLINNINPQEPTPYHYKDTRSDEQKRAEGNYFTDEQGNIVQPSDEDLELFGSWIISREFTLDKVRKPGYTQIVEDFQFGSGHLAGYGNMYFWDRYNNNGNWSGEARRDVLYDAWKTSYYERNNWDVEHRDKGVYYIKSELRMQWSNGQWYTHRGENYAFISKNTPAPVVVNNEKIDTTNTDYTEANGKAIYSANIVDTTDEYRQYGISINNGPRQILSGTQINRTPRNDEDAWKNIANTKNTNFDIRYELNNLGLGNVSFQLEGQKHAGSSSDGWEDIGSEISTTIVNKTDHPHTPRITVVNPLDKPLPNGGNQGRIEIRGDYTKATNSAKYPVTQVDVSKDDGTNWIKADNWNISSASWSHTFKNLTAQTYNFKVRIQHNGFPTNHVVSGSWPHTLDALSIPNGNIIFDYGTPVKASDGYSNGEFHSSGTYDDNDKLVNKVETQMSFDNGVSWTAWKEVDTHDKNNNSFTTKLTGIPGGQVQAKIRLTYDSGTSSSSDDGTIEEIPPIETMEVLQDPLLDEANSNMKLTLTSEADYGTSYESSMRLEVELHDPDDQISRVQVKHQKLGSGNWTMNEIPGNEINTLPNNNKEIDYIIPNLASEEEYLFHMNVQLKRTGKWIKGYNELGPITTIEQPIEATVTNGNETKPSKWGMNDGKVAGIVTVPAPTNNSTVTKVDAYLKKTNDSSYSYLYPGAITTNGITDIEFIGNNTYPIFASEEYYIEIEYEWKSNSGLVYSFDRTSDLIIIEHGSEEPPEIQKGPNGIKTFPPSHNTKDDGRINFEFEIINDYNSRIESIEVELYNTLSPLVEQSLIFFEPDPEKTITGQFKNLSSDMYEIKVLATYTINKNPIVNEEMNTVSNIVVDETGALAPEATIDNIIVKDTSKLEPSNSEDYGSIKFDYQLDNKNDAKFTDDIIGTTIHLDRLNEATNKWSEVGNSKIDTANFDNVAGISREHTFDKLLAGTYQIRITSNFELDGILSASDELIGSSSKIIIKEPSDVQLYAIKNVSPIKNNIFKMNLKINDVNNVLIEDTLEVTVKINGEEVKTWTNRPIEENDFIIDNYTEKIYNYEVLIRAELKNGLGMWDGDPEFRENAYKDEGFEENSENLIIIITSSIVAGLAIIIFLMASFIYLKIN